MLNSKLSAILLVLASQKLRNTLNIKLNTLFILHIFNLWTGITFGQNNQILSHFLLYAPWAKQHRRSARGQCSGATFVCSSKSVSTSRAGMVAWSISACQSSGVHLFAIEYSFSTSAEWAWQRGISAHGQLLCLQLFLHFLKPFISMTLGCDLNHSSGLPFRL